MSQRRRRLPAAGARIFAVGLTVLIGAVPANLHSSFAQPRCSDCGGGTPACILCYQFYNDTCGCSGQKTTDWLYCDDSVCPCSVSGPCATAILMDPDFEPVRIATALLCPNGHQNDAPRASEPDPYGRLAR